MLLVLLPTICLQDRFENMGDKTRNIDRFSTRFAASSSYTK